MTVFRGLAPLLAKERIVEVCQAELGTCIGEVLADPRIDLVAELSGVMRVPVAAEYYTANKTAQIEDLLANSGLFVIVERWSEEVTESLESGDGTDDGEYVRQAIEVRLGFGAPMNHPTIDRTGRTQTTEEYMTMLSELYEAAIIMCVLRHMPDNVIAERVDVHTSFASAAVLPEQPDVKFAGCRIRFYARQSTSVPAPTYTL